MADAAPRGRPIDDLHLSFDPASYRAIYQRSVTRSEAKAIIRDRIATLRTHVRVVGNDPTSELSEQVRWAARLRNRCAHLVALHRGTDWP